MSQFQNKIKESRGSILNIVLILFLAITFVIGIALTTTKSNLKNYQMIDLMMKQKNLEILLIEYYIDKMENDILLSDFYENQNMTINSQVDDMGSYFEITTYIESEKINYYFVVKISIETYDVLHYEYGEV